MDVADIAPGLQRHADGYWIAPSAGEVSYPAEGSSFCFSVEESSFWFRHRNEAILAAVRRHPPAGGPLFDVGAGNGFVSAALARHGIETVAIEPSPVGARNAVRRGVDPVLCGVFPSDAFKPAAAGAIGLFDVVEHLVHDRELLSSMRPYLRPGGRLYLTVPAHRWLWSSEDVAAGHHRRYTLRELKRVVTEAGYRVEYATYFFSLLPLPIFLARTIPSRLGRTRPPAPATAATHHTAGSSTARGLIERTLSFELKRIAAGRRIPFGASCLLVAGQEARSPTDHQLRNQRHQLSATRS